MRPKNSLNDTQDEISNKELGVCITNYSECQTRALGGKTDGDMKDDDSISRTQPKSTSGVS